MVTISNFGWRLGNQIFMIAAAYALAKENNTEFLCPEWAYQRYFKISHKVYQGEPIELFYSELGFHYEKIKYSENIALNGYFQSLKYSSVEIFNELFEFNYDNISRFSYIEEGGNSGGGFDLSVEDIYACAIHVRRGDYLKYPEHHPVCPEYYYNVAIKQMFDMGFRNFMVFSDDIEWCNGFFKSSNFGDANFYFSENNNEIVDFVAMSKCEHQIISNSTFSLLSAVLNKNKDKVIISPDKSNWHGPAYAHWNHNDLIPENFIQIKY